MSGWVVVPCLLALRDEFNRIAPKRVKGADGTIGDTAHQRTGTSDHLPDEDTPALRGKDPDKTNEVHALDIDSTGPWPGGAAWFDATVKRIVDRHRQGLDNRLRYVIWNRRIAEASYGWAWRTYTGSADPHTGHAHFSASYQPKAEADTAAWHVIHLEEDPMAALTDAQQKALAAQAHHTWLMVRNLESLVNALAAGQQSRPAWKDVTTGYTYPATGLAPNMMLQRVLGADGVSEAEMRKLLADMVPTAAENAGAVSAELGTDLVDEGAIIAGVLAGLTPEQAGAIPEATAQRVVELLTARLSA